MVTDSRQKRFVMNMQLRQCFARAKTFRVKKSGKDQILSGVKKVRISQSDFKKAKLANMTHGW